MSTGKSRAMKEEIEVIAENRGKTGIAIAVETIVVETIAIGGIQGLRKPRRGQPPKSGCRRCPAAE